MAEQEERVSDEFSLSIEEMYVGLRSSCQAVGGVGLNANQFDWIADWIKETDSDLRTARTEIERLTAENEGLREALEFYAAKRSHICERNAYDIPQASHAMLDKGERARRALDGEKPTEPSKSSGSSYESP
jgi:hypothetical protein